MTFGEWIDEGIDGRRPPSTTSTTTARRSSRRCGPRLARAPVARLPPGRAGRGRPAPPSPRCSSTRGGRARPREACADASATEWTQARQPRHPRSGAGAGRRRCARRAAAEALDRTDAPDRWAEAVADAAERWPARGRCPADDLEERLRRRHEAAQLADPRPRCSRGTDGEVETDPAERADALAAGSAESRARTLALLEPFDEAVLRRQHDALMSPLVWDLAHVANYEDLWLVRALGGEPTRTGSTTSTTPSSSPAGCARRCRSSTPAGARAYGDAVRARALDRARRAPTSTRRPDPLLRHGFVHGMVVQHEHQHDETMLATIQLLPDRRGPRPRPRPPPPAGRP